MRQGIPRRQRRSDWRGPDAEQLLISCKYTIEDFVRVRVAWVDSGSRRPLLLLEDRRVVVRSEVIVSVILGIVRIVRVHVARMRRTAQTTAVVIVLTIEATRTTVINKPIRHHRCPLEGWHDGTRHHWTVVSGINRCSRRCGQRHRLLGWRWCCERINVGGRGRQRLRSNRFGWRRGNQRRRLCRADGIGSRSDPGGSRCGGLRDHGLHCRCRRDRSRRDRGLFDGCLDDLPLDRCGHEIGRPARGEDKQAAVKHREWLSIRRSVISVHRHPDDAAT